MQVGWNFKHSADKFLVWCGQNFIGKSKLIYSPLLYCDVIFFNENYNGLQEYTITLEIPTVSNRQLDLDMVSV